MRPFSRKNRASRFSFQVILMWGAVAMLVAWGLWQGNALREKVLAQARLSFPVNISNHRSSKASNPDDQSPSPPVIQRMFLSAQGNSGWSSTGMSLDHPDIVEVLSPGVLGRTDHLIFRANQALSQGHLIAARTALNRALVLIGGFGELQAVQVRAELSRLNLRTLLGSGIIPNDPLIRLLPIQQGYSFDYLAYLYRITPELLTRLNPEVNTRNLLPGSGIKVILGPFDARIILQASRMDVVNHGLYILSVPLRTGSLAMVTPGRYKLQPGSEVEFKNPLNGRNGYRMMLVPMQIAGGSILLGRKVVIATPPVAAGALEASSRSLRLIFELLSPKFSRVEILP